MDIVPTPGTYNLIARKGMKPQAIQLISACLVGDHPDFIVPVGTEGWLAISYRHDGSNAVRTWSVRPEQLTKA